MVCPDCHTWCPIAGAQGAAPKLPPHHTAPASQDDTAQEERPTAHRCIGSNRRVVLDVTTAEWLRQYARATENGCAPEARRGTTLIKRPSAPAPAVTQMRPVPVASPAQAAHRAAQEELARHRSRCSRCQPRQHGQTSNPCVQGALLRLRAITAQRAYVSASTPA